MGWLYPEGLEPIAAGWPCRGVPPAPPATTPRAWLTGAALEGHSSGNVGAKPTCSEGAGKAPRIPGAFKLNSRWSQTWKEKASSFHPQPARYRSPRSDLSWSQILSSYLAVDLTGGTGGKQTWPTEPWDVPVAGGMEGTLQGLTQVPYTSAPEATSWRSARVACQGQVPGQVLRRKGSWPWASLYPTRRPLRKARFLGLRRTSRETVDQGGDPWSPWGGEKGRSPSGHHYLTC